MPRHIKEGFTINNSTLSDISEIICREIKRSYNIFPVYPMKNKYNLGIVIPWNLHIPLAETIKELDNFKLKSVDLYDNTNVFL